MYTIFLANGFEEIEAISVIDILRRANIDIRTVSISDKHEVTGAHDIKIKADLLISEITSNEIKGIILPGGLPGTTNLAESEELRNLLNTGYDKGNLIAAICAAPTIIKDNNLFAGYSITSYPSYKNDFTNYNYIEVDVVRAKNLITSRGAGTAGDFAFAIVDYIKGENSSSKLRDSMVY